MMGVTEDLKKAQAKMAADELGDCLGKIISRRSWMEWLPFRIVSVRCLGEMMIRVDQVKGAITEDNNESRDRISVT